MRCVVSGGRGSANRAASTTFYGTLVGLHGATSAPTESDWQGAIPIAGEFTRFMAHVTVNTRGASTYTFRVNGADGNQSLSVGASTTGWFVDTTNSDTVVAGDLVSYKVVTGAGGSSFQDHVVGAVFNVASSNISLLGLHNDSAFSVASTTSPLPIHGAPQTAATESDLQLRFWKGGTLDRLYTNIRANTRSDATTLKTRINGADGNISVSIPASTTGVFSDTSNSDTIADDDLVNLALVTGAGTGSITPRTTYSVFSATERYSYFQCAGSSLQVNANLTRYNILQYLSLQNANETLMTTQVGVADTYLSHLRAYVGTNSITPSTTVKLRLNNADAGPTVSIGSSATGEFTDTTNGFLCASETDKVNYCVVTGAGGTAITLRSLGVLVGHPQTLTGVLASSAAAGLVGDVPAGTTLTGNLANATGQGLVAADPTVGALGVTGLLASATGQGLVAATPTIGALGLTGLLGSAVGLGLTGSLGLGALGLTALLPSAAASGFVGTVGLGALALTALLASAGGSAFTGSLSLGALTLTALLGTAAGTALVGSLSSGSILTGLLASASATALVAATPTLGSLGLTAVLASAAVTALVSTAAAGSLGVTGLLASAGAAALVAATPTLGGVGLTSVLATATATALVGSTTLGAVLVGLLAQANGTALLATITASGSVLLSGLLATAASLGLTGSFGVFTSSAAQPSRYEPERRMTKSLISKATASGFESLRRIAFNVIKKG